MMFAVTDTSGQTWIAWVYLCCASAVSWLEAESTRHWLKGKRASQAAKSSFVCTTCKTLYHQFWWYKVVLYTTLQFIYHLKRWHINLNSSSHKHRSEHFTVLGRLSIIIMLLYHFHTGSCGIGYVRYGQSIVDCDRYSRMAEHVGV